MPQARIWGAQRDFKGSRLQWAQTLGKELEKAKFLQKTGKLRDMTDAERILEYNKSIK